MLGDGLLGLHTSKCLLNHADPAVAVAIGRAPPKLEIRTLGGGDPRHSYHALHVKYELDLREELLDRVKPQVTVNYTAQRLAEELVAACMRR